MTTKTHITEKDIAAAVVKHLEAQGLKVRQEVPVVLPDHGQVTADIVACLTDDSCEWFTVVEVKRRLDETLEAQVMRWLGYANRIIACYLLAGRWTAVLKHRATRLDLASVGRWAVNRSLKTMDTQQIQPFHSLADTRLISQAFHSHDGSHDPAAGSAAAKRMTPERCKWEPLRKFLHEFWPDVVAHSWAFIRREVPPMRTFTAAQVRKAIDKGECPGVGYRGSAITEFFATEETK